MVRGAERAEAEGYSEECDPGITGTVGNAAEEGETFAESDG